MTTRAEILYTRKSEITVLKFPAGGVTVELTPESAEMFEKLIRRGLNTWADAPAVIKEFGDLLLNGKIQQNYRPSER